MNDNTAAVNKNPEYLNTLCGNICTVTGRGPNNNCCERLECAQASVSRKHARTQTLTASKCI